MMVKRLGSDTLRMFFTSPIVIRRLLFCGLAILLSSPLPARAAQKVQVCKKSILATTPTADFTIHRDGTVTQKNTGLMWMRCSLGQKWDGKTCTGVPSDYTWKEALQAAKRFKFAGYDDWRLPNKNELESIVESSCYSPAINETIFPATPPVFYWSSSPYAGFSGGAWSVDFGFGAVNSSNKANDKEGVIPVRLVRGGQ